MTNTKNNLMHISSPNIGNMDTVYEYQKLALNNKIGEYLKHHDIKMRKSITLNFKSRQLENIWEKLELKFELYMSSSTRILIITDNYLAELWWQYDSSYTGISLSVSSNSISNCNKYIDEIKDYLKDDLISDSVVEYTILQYENSETINDTFYQDTIDIEFNPLAVPFVEDTDQYISNFLNSKAPILILQGEPGTGKTTFTKQILKKMKDKVLKDNDNFNALYSFDENIFYVSDFFKRIIYDDYDVLVLEDINQILHKSQDETGSLNPLNKFLSVTDGLISKYKKIIITTNIESKAQLNQALTRPGRCFDILNFRKLEGVEIDNLCDSCATDLNLQTESINVSEFYAKRNGEQNSNLTCSKIGF